MNITITYQTGYSLSSICLEETNEILVIFSAFFLPLPSSVCIFYIRETVPKCQTLEQAREAPLNGTYTATRRNHFVLCLLLAFLAGAVLSGILFNKQRPRSIGELDRLYAAEHGRATEIIGRLTAELERERELNRELREHNEQARAIAGGLTVSVERNVGNLQEAIGLISEIRKKLKVLEDFYADSGSRGNAIERYNSLGQ